MKKGMLVTLTLLLFVSNGLGQRAKPGPPPPPANPAIAFENMGNVDPLRVMDADGSNKTTVYSAAIPGLFSPSWSPLGAGTQFNPYSIAFNQCCPPTLRRVDVTLVNGVPQGSNVITLADEADCGFCGGPAWSPLGDEITVSGAGINGFGLVAVDAVSGVATVLYTPPAGRIVGDSAWSPDGSEIAFAESSESGPPNPVVKILNRGTGVVTDTLLAGLFTDIRELDWARTQNLLAFAASTGSATNPNFSIYTVNLPAGSPSWLIGPGRSPSFSPDDSNLVFAGTGKGQAAGIKVYSFANGTVTTLGGSFSADWRR